MDESDNALCHEIEVTIDGLEGEVPEVGDRVMVPDDEKGVIYRGVVTAVRSLNWGAWWCLQVEVGSKEVV